MAQPTETLRKPVDIQERMEFLKGDLMHLFDDQGVDESQYDDVVTFLDPITRYSSVQGYMFNIRMLKAVFEPAFELHDIRQTAEYEATTRWTMTMKFTPAAKLGLAKWWSPSLIFTGTSAYGFNPANGRINRHVDTWDSVANQDFFSLEAFADFWRQLLDLSRTPERLETPSYTVLRRTAEYQVRRYEPFLVAESHLDGVGAAPPAPAAAEAQPQQGQKPPEASSSGAGAGPRFNPASAGVNAFRRLADYIFGGNTAGERMGMTTPVLSDTSGAMFFVIPSSKHADLATLPAPRSPDVTTRQLPGGLFAARAFTGVAAPSACDAAARQLRSALQRDGLLPAAEGASAPEYRLARYNDPSVPPPFRRNEVLIQLDSFDLWS